jgi:hypothetical protein
MINLLSNVSNWHPLVIETYLGDVELIFNIVQQDGTVLLDSAEGLAKNLKQKLIKETKSCSMQTHLPPINKKFLFTKRQPRRGVNVIDEQKSAKYNNT